ncbi:MAG: arginine--tRNA ligase [Propionibacteriales bacterium]|nr:arginine--tRNA ligase [Propionibacteriales bacterium]
MTPEQLSQTIRDTLAELVRSGDLTLPAVPERVKVERPKVKEHGDYATNVALQLAKQAGLPPRELAQRLADRLADADGVKAAEVAGPGFLNVRVEAAAQGELAREIVRAGTAYGTSRSLSGERVNLEFVSANPTGPLTLASTRWAAVGDAQARVLAAAGADVTREYYFNDHGAQIDRFSRSLLARSRGEDVPEDGYPGAYIEEIAQQVVGARPDVKGLPDDDAQEVFRAEGVGLMFDEIKRSLHDFGVDFDVYFSERDLHDSGEVDEAVERLRGGGLTYESEGALWLRSTEYDDDRDRVLVRRDGRPTYICADAAYYLDKRGRGFDRVVILLGADHHGYINRYRALAAAFGDDPDRNLEMIIGQMVNLLREGRPVRMSKRAGDVLTMEDLVEAIGIDAARYALTRYSMDSTIEIDLDLWAKQANDNPVFYVQYAHARLASILRNAADLGVAPAGDEFDPGLLSHEREGDLLRALGEYPRVVQQAADLREPHRIARYLEDTAATFHKFYDECRVLPRGDEEPTPLHAARLLLVEATRVVVANGLGLLGVHAPERM